MQPEAMLTDRRAAGAFPPALLSRAAVVWALLCLALLLINSAGIAAWRFPDPDDVLRLVQVRDLLAGQGWFDLTQSRIDAAHGGVPMHWSRLVDVPIALVIAMLRPLLGTAAAETAALVIVPLITLGAVIVLTMRIAWRLLGDEAALLSAVVMAIAVPVLFQLGPMRIDHHGWQIVCALAAINGLMARSPVVGGRVIGAMLATWLAISIEGLPLAAAIFAVLALRWLHRRDARIWLIAAIQSLAVVSIGLFLLTRGFADLATWCDAISPVHLAMFAWGAVVLTALGRWEQASPAVLMAGFALAGGGALAMLLAAAPHCALDGGFSALDPLVKQIWYEHVSEGLPIWQQRPAVLLQYAVTPLIGLTGAVMLARRAADGAIRQFWFDYALVLGAAFVIALLVARAGAVACVLAAPPLAWLLGYWLERIRSFERPLTRMIAMVGVAFVLMPVLPLTALNAAAPAHPSLGQLAIAPRSDKSSTCALNTSIKTLQALPKGTIYAPLDIAPAILLDTGHSVLATGHHRGNLAIRSMITIAFAPEGEARAGLAANNIAYVVLCADQGEPRMYAALAPAGFMAQLVKGEAPDWLEPVPLAQGTTLKVWRISPARTSSPPR